jgi:hypothetical protein
MLLNPIRIFRAKAQARALIREMRNDSRWETIALSRYDQELEKNAETHKKWDKKGKSAIFGNHRAFFQTYCSEHIVSTLSARSGTAKTEVMEIGIGGSGTELQHPGAPAEPWELLASFIGGGCYPHIAVTDINPRHLEQFRSIDRVRVSQLCMEQAVGIFRRKKIVFCDLNELTEYGKQVALRLNAEMVGAERVPQGQVYANTVFSLRVPSHLRSLFSTYQLDFVSGDSEKICRARFNLVLMLNVFGYLGDPLVATLGLSNLLSFAKPGGIIAFSYNDKFRYMDPILTSEFESHFGYQLFRPQPPSFNKENSGLRYVVLEKQ